VVVADQRRADKSNFFTKKDYFNFVEQLARSYPPPPKSSSYDVAPSRSGGLTVVVVVWRRRRRRR
jgi:hypothetical protein